MTNVYLAGDTGPSGFGVATRGLLDQLLQSDEINVTCRTHFWGLNRDGIHFSNRSFPDKRFQERILREGDINEDHLMEDPRELPEREDDLLNNLGTNPEVDPEKCIVREFEGQEDVWLAIGGANFAEQAPRGPYTIVSTDFNLDIVPRDWEYCLNQVDEFWVPSEWTRQAVLNRVGWEHSDSVRSFHYGIPMEYRPTEYDCRVCPHNKGQMGPGGPSRCLRDDSVNFLVVSRFYHIKGLYRTIKAFIEEFRANEDVRLFIKSTSNNQFEFNPVASAQSVANELGYPDTPEIGFATDFMETQYMYDLLGHCDAFIQASRAECFGIAQVQAAYCGTPVIYTNWSSQAEILDDETDGFLSINDYQIEPPRQESPAFAFDVHGDYPPDANWATPSVEAIQERMREVFEMSSAERDQLGQSAKQFVEERYDWADKAEPRIDRLKGVSA